jgi:hypothetical protein
MTMMLEEEPSKKREPKQSDLLEPRVMESAIEKIEKAQRLKNNNNQ